MVVIDISSFKNAKSNRFRALRKVRPLVNRIVGLTGTPAPNSLIDLWSQIYLLDMGERLGKTFSGYRDRYFNYDPYRFQTALKPESENNIYNKIDDICISMKAKDHLQLPERIHNVIELELSPKERTLYKELEKERVLEFSDGDIVAQTAATLSGKLLQLSSGAAYNEFGEVQYIHDVSLTP